MDACLPDSTVVIFRVNDEAPVNQELESPLQLLKQHYMERSTQCREAVAAARRDRDVVEVQLQNVRKNREIILDNCKQMMETSRNMAHNLSNVKISLEEAFRKRYALMREIEAEKMRQLPSTEMPLKKQRELRERVEHMRAILHNGKISEPDD